MRFESLHRFVLHKGYAYLVRKLLKLGLKDTETGCKFFDRERILPLLKDIKDNYWFWDTEIMARAYYNGLKIREIPFYYERKWDKSSSVNIIRDSILYIIKLLRFRKELKRVYK